MSNAERTKQDTGLRGGQGYVSKIEKSTALFCITIPPFSGIYIREEWVAGKPEAR